MCERLLKTALVGTPIRLRRRPSQGIARDSVCPRSTGAGDHRALAHPKGHGVSRSEASQFDGDSEVGRMMKVKFENWPWNIKMPKTLGFTLTNVNHVLFAC